ncbi:MAG: efflux RND transporter periplasmic adaptor subunit [Anaerolineales bacterium]|nr:efflux RND transporter periplasmic adaptor subunit [Anaerolineales bacterium]
MKNKIFASKKARWILLGIVALAIVGGSAAYYFTNTAQASVATETPLQTASAYRGSIVLQSNGTGTLAPANTVSFGFGTSGQITELTIKIGDQVEAGQVIGKMDDTEAKAAYEQAKRNLADITTPAAVAEAEQAVADAEVEITNALKTIKFLVSPDVFYWEGQLATAQETLKEAQADAGSSPTAEQKKKVDEATATLDRAQKNLEAAKLTYINEYAPENFTFTYTYTNDEDKETTTKEVIPPSDAEIAAARATYQLAVENQKEAQAFLDFLNGGPLPDAVTGSTITSLVDAQTALQTAEDNLVATQLTSPITGTVTALTASVGDYVSASSIVTVSDLSQPYTIDAYFDAEDWTSIQAGYEADVVFDILPDDTYTGEVTAVYPELDSSSSSSLVHAIVKLNENIKTDLPAGASAAVDVTSGRAENVTLIPIEALHETSPGKYAVFVMQNGKPRLRVIEIGLKDLLHAEVKSGVEAGDVVTTGITAVQ